MLTRERYLRQQQPCWGGAVAGRRHFWTGGPQVLQYHRNIPQLGAHMNVLYRRAREAISLTDESALRLLPYHQQ